MREIKFRIWAETDNGNEMIYLGQLECDNGLWFDSPVEHIDKYIQIMQFTGLKDKRGTDIYEGDLLDFGNKNPVEVIFEHGCFTVFGEPLGWDFDSEEHPVKTDFKYCEVVGNIHQHPELLK